MTPHAFLTPDQVAEELQISRDVVLTMCKNGELRAVKIGTGGRTSPWRVRADWLDQWADNHTYTTH